MSSNDPRMPDNLNTMYETLADRMLALGNILLALDEYGVGKSDINIEVSRRLDERSRGLSPEEMDRMADALKRMAHMHSEEYMTSVKIVERLMRAERETGTPAVEAIIMLRGGGHGLRGLLSQDGIGLKMLCPESPPSGRPGTMLGNEVFFDYADVLAVGFPASITIEGSKIHMS